MITHTTYPTNPLTLPQWFAYIHNEVSRQKRINKPLERIKADMARNKFKTK